MHVAITNNLIASETLWQVLGFWSGNMVTILYIAARVLSIEPAE